MEKQILKTIIKTFCLVELSFFSKSYVEKKTNMEYLKDFNDRVDSYVDLIMEDNNAKNDKTETERSIQNKDRNKRSAKRKGK